MEQFAEDQNVNDFNDFQKRIKTDIYPANKSIEYLSLKLASETGRLAKEASQIARGDYDNKGALSYANAIEEIMYRCNAILECVAMISTVIEKDLSDIIVHGRESRKQRTL